MEFIEKLKTVDPAALDFADKDKLLSMVFDALMEIAEKMPEDAQRLCLYEIDRKNRTAHYPGEVRSEYEVTEIEQSLDKYICACRDDNSIDFFSNIATSIYFIGKILTHSKSFDDNEATLVPLFLALEIRKAVEAQQYSYPIAYEVSASYNSIGMIYEKAGDLDKAYMYYDLDRQQCEKRLDAAEYIGQINGALNSLSYSYETMAKVLEKQGNKEKANEYFDLAREYFERSL